MDSSRAVAKVKPALIAWARQSARVSLDDAAKRAKIDRTILAGWEAGSGAPTIGQLRKLAATYKRPIVVFYLPEPPKDFDALRDYRRLPGDEEFPESPELAGEIRWAREMREVALEACAVTGTEIPQLGLSANFERSTAEVVAQEARTLLGVSVSEGRSWSSPYDAFNRWRAAIEGRGVLCLQFSGVDVAEARAFAIGEFPLPVAAVNTKDAITARLFSLLHEFTHLVLGRPGKCDLHDSSRGSDERDRIETFCNAVAGRILVPEDALRERLGSGTSTTPKGWDDESLRLLARPFGVSRDAILRRLLDIGQTTAAYYNEKRAAWKKALADAGPGSDDGGGNYYTNLRTKLGSPLIRTVMSAYHSGGFTANEAAAFLSVKVGNLDRLASGVR